MVNVILRKDYEGTEIEMCYGNSEANSNDAVQGINVTWGGRLGSQVSLLSTIPEKLFSIVIISNAQ